MRITRRSFIGMLGAIAPAALLGGETDVAASFPTSVATLTNPSAGDAVDSTTVPHATQHANANDEIEATQTKVGTGASTPTTAGHVLYVTGAGATAYGARAMVRIAEVSLGVGATTIDFTNIPQTYRGLRIEMSSRNDTGSQNITMRFSSDGTTFDTGANYDYQRTLANITTTTSLESLGNTSINCGAHSAAANVMNPTIIEIPDYTQTTHHKCVEIRTSIKEGTSSGNLTIYRIGGFWRNTAAIAGIRLLTGANNFGVGTRATLFGTPQ